MISPARAHQQRILAAQAAANASPDEPMQGSEHELMLAQLYEHKKTLKEIKSVEKKVEAKRTFVAEYDNYLGAVLTVGKGGDDIIVTTLMVWNIDAGRYDHALALAQYVLTHRLKMPDQYNRDPATLLADEFSTAALAGHIDAAAELRVLSQVWVLTQDADMPDQARAKLHKAMGYAILGKHGGADVDLAKVGDDAARTAEAQLSRALALYEQVGVKKDLERLARRLKNAAPGSDRADPAPGGPVSDGSDATASQA